MIIMSNKFAVVLIAIFGILLASFFMFLYVVPPKLSSSDTELKNIVIEFLKTTDVSRATWDGTVNIKEIYDHKLGGKVIVANYTTMNAIHPYFMAEAIEDHTAVITLDSRGEVVSAFCVWGTFHGQSIWDLINQRWIRK